MIDLETTVTAQRGRRRSPMDGAGGERGFDATRDLPGLDLARARRYSRARLASLAIGTGWLAARSALFALSGASARLAHLSRRVAPHPALADPLYLGAAATASWLARLPAAYALDHRVE